MKMGLLQNIDILANPVFCLLFLSAIQGLHMTASSTMARVSDLEDHDLYVEHTCTDIDDLSETVHLECPSEIINGRRQRYRIYIVNATYGFAGRRLCEHRPWDHCVEDAMEEWEVAKCMNQEECDIDNEPIYVHACDKLSKYLTINYICIEAKNLREACDERLTVSPSGYIVSNDYPTEHEHDIHCQCSLELPNQQTALLTLEVMDFSLEEYGYEGDCFDYVEVLEEGESEGEGYHWCDFIPSGTSYVLDNKVTRTIFHTDDSIALRGFFIKYYAETPSGYPVNVRVQCEHIEYNSGSGIPESEWYTSTSPETPRPTRIPTKYTRSTTKGTTTSRTNSPVRTTITTTTASTMTTTSTTTTTMPLPVPPESTIRSTDQPEENSGSGTTKSGTDENSAGQQSNENSALTQTAIIAIAACVSVIVIVLGGMVIIVYCCRRKQAPSPKSASESTKPKVMPPSAINITITPSAPPTEDDYLELTGKEVKYSTSTKETKHVYTTLQGENMVFRSKSILEENVYEQINPADVLPAYGNPGYDHMIVPAPALSKSRGTPSYVNTAESDKQRQPSQYLHVNQNNGNSQMPVKSTNYDGYMKPIP